METTKQGSDDSTKARRAMTACMEHLDQLDPEEARRVLRSLSVWYEDESDRARLAEDILESLGEIGAALRQNS